MPGLFHYFFSPSSCILAFCLFKDFLVSETKECALKTFKDHCIYKKIKNFTAVGRTPVYYNNNV